jgi:hypothetical protein
MKIHTATLILVNLLMLGGCSSFPGAGVAVIPIQVITNDGIKHLSKKYQNAVCINTDTEGCATSGLAREGTWLSHIEDCQSVDANFVQCKSIRNSIVNELLLIVDHHYHSYEGGLLAGRAKNNFYTGAFRSGLETAGALLTVASTVKVLSGLAALTGTVQDSADKEFYYDNTINALVIQMRADRTLVLVTLFKGQKKDYSDYPLERAVRDITSYYRSGTLASAIVSLSNTAAESEAKAKKSLDES